MSVFDLLNSNNYIQDQRIVRERINTCFNCPGGRYYRPTGQCRDCLCFITEKAKLHTENCPNGFWRKLQ